MSRTAARRRLRGALAFTVSTLVVIGGALTATFVSESGSSAAQSFGGALLGSDVQTATVAEGVVPEGVTVFDDRYPAVVNLDTALLQALREAAEDAADDGVPFFVNSGWRSADYQDRLRLEAVSTYGSEEEAARWVATGDTSAHVSGDAVDIGPSDATAWLSAHGSRYGLCQIYGNEPWHYELRPEAVDRGCPEPFADPTHDPRMQE